VISWTVGGDSELSRKPEWMLPKTDNKYEFGSWTTKGD